MCFFHLALFPRLIPGLTPIGTSSLSMNEQYFFGCMYYSSLVDGNWSFSCIQAIRNHVSVNTYVHVFVRVCFHFSWIEVKLLLLSHFSRVRLCATPQTEAHQAPPSLGFSRQEYWSGLPFPCPMHESENERKLLSRVRLLATLWTTAYQAPLSMGFSRQEQWSGVPLPSLQWT